MSSRDSPISVCVIGCGHWGKNLARNFHNIGHLYGLCDTHQARFEQLAAQYPQARRFYRFEDVLADPGVQAVAISTPAELHTSMGIAALQAGKDTFVEKPLALNPEDGLEMLHIANRAKRILMVGHLLLYHPAIRLIHQLLISDELGRLEYIYSNRLSMGKIRREENALWSFAPHDISVVLMLMGQLPLQVTAVGGAYLQPNIADVTVSNLLFERGARAHIFVSWLHPYKEQRLVVIGSKKMLVFEDTRPTDKLVLFDKQVEWAHGMIEVAQPKGVPLTFDASEPLRLECEHFIHCVRTRQKPLTSAEEGLRVLQVLQACQRSLQLNGEPVQIDSISIQPILRM